MALSPHHDYWTCECEACQTEREDDVDRWLDAQAEREQAALEARDVAEMRRLEAEDGK